MIYFYDTCSLLNHSKEIFEAKQKFIISDISIKELENIKISDNKDAEIKYKARKLLHLLEKYEYKYEIAIFKNKYKRITARFSLPTTNDSKIIATAYYYNKHKYIDEVMFYTDDLSCKYIAKSIGLKVFHHINNDKEEYTGYIKWNPNSEMLAEFYNKYLTNHINFLDLNINQYLIIQQNNEIIDKYKWTGEEYNKIPFYKIESKMFGKISPKNNDDYQHIALDSLATNKITMIRGAAGTGKSYLSFGYMFYLLEKGIIDKIIIFCNTVATKGSAKLGLIIG